jgi:hypothetical protein
LSDGLVVELRANLGTYNGVPFERERRQS